jgi:hypothetical protein
MLWVVFVAGTLALFTWLSPRPIPTEASNLRFVKVDQNGQAISLWAGPWQCVHDSSTGLLWEVKTYKEDIHDHQCSFSWYQEGFGTGKGGDCFIEGEASDTSDIIRSANSVQQCGSAFWRLPTEAELKSLIITRVKPGQPFINNSYFPYTKNGPYWTSNGFVQLTGHFEYLGEGARAIDFSTGKAYTMPYKHANFVRLVADKYGISSLNSSP